MRAGIRYAEGQRWMQKERATLQPALHACHSLDTENPGRLQTAGVALKTG